jgi:hypothetical protein
MTDKAISPSRRRLIEDMTIRRLGPKTQLHYIRHVKRQYLEKVGRENDIPILLALALFDPDDHAVTIPPPPPCVTKPLAGSADSKLMPRQEKVEDALPFQPQEEAARDSSVAPETAAPH